MGGVVSAADDNDELIDNLVSAACVKTVAVEKALRCVDRGHYFPDNFRKAAYRDTAWKNGYLHLSAPCIYARALEYLDVEPGMSFLNLGSGTGYLNTVVGFLLGPYGQNYGVELNDEAVAYSELKLRQFVTSAIYVNTQDFAEPKFICGNCLQLDTVANGQLFDRMYCGATVTTDNVEFLKHLLKVGGSMVFPQGDQLSVLKRHEADLFEKLQIIPVSFAAMVQPSAGQSNVDSLPPHCFKTLKEICRLTIRQMVRDCSSAVCKTAENGCPPFRTRCLVSRLTSNATTAAANYFSPGCHGSGGSNGMKDGNNGQKPPASQAADQECDGSDPALCTASFARKTFGRRSKKLNPLWRNLYEGCRDPGNKEPLEVHRTSSTENVPAPYDYMERQSAGGINIYKYSTRKRQRKFSDFISRVLRPLVAAAVVENEGVINTDDDDDNPSTIRSDADSALHQPPTDDFLLCQPSTSKALNEKTIPGDENSTSSKQDDNASSATVVRSEQQQHEEDNNMKGMYLPDNFPTFESDEDAESDLAITLSADGRRPSTVVGVDRNTDGADEGDRETPLVQQNSSEMSLDDHTVSTGSSSSKRFRTKSGYSDDGTLNTRKKKILCNRLSHNGQSTTQYATVSDGNENARQADQPDEDGDGSRDGDENGATEDQEEEPENDDDDDDDDENNEELEELHRQHMKTNRERSRQALLAFAGDFDRRVARLPLPRSLVDFLVFERRLDDTFFSDSTHKSNKTCCSVVH